MHKSTVLRFVLIAFLGGVAFAPFVSVPAGVVWVLVAAAAAVMTAGRRATVVGLCVLAVAYGAHLTTTARTDDTVLYRLAADKAQVTIIGYMDGGLKQGSAGWSLYVAARQVGDTPVHERLLVRTAGQPPLAYGDGVRLEGRLGRATSFADFDYPAYLRKEGVRAVMVRPRMDRATVDLPLTERAAVAAVRGIGAVRDAFTASVRRAVPEPASSYLVGILVGGRAALPQRVVDDFSRTSTSHVLAISGYNITILAMAVMTALAGHLGRRRAMLVTIGAIAVFVVMTGAGASVVRAAVMGVLVLVAGALSRQADMGAVILLSAAVMVWSNPLLLRDDVGFQLSFAALIGLVYLEPLITARLGRAGEHAVGRIVSSTTAAQLAVLPLILYYFHTLSVVGPLANLLILPAVPMTMALGFATGIAGLVLSAAGRAVGLLAWAAAAYQLTAVRYLASLPWAAFELRINGQILVALYGILFIWWHLAHTPAGPGLEQKPGPVDPEK